MPPKDSIQVPAAVAGIPVNFEERGNFKLSLLKNPNFFGTFPGLGNVVKQIQFDTTFEQVTCVGLNPGPPFGKGTLEAVIQIKQPTGYNSGPCDSGSTEWVRFFVEDGNTWTDVGVTGVTVYNLQGSALPVSYAVSIPLSHVKKFCSAENVLNVRAILSWEFQPPSDHTFIPVFGNVLDARVQIAPAFIEFTAVGSLIESGLLKVDPSVAAVLDETKTLPAKPVHPLPFGELKKLYADSKVPAHRFGFTEALNSAKSVEKVLSVAAAFKGLAISAADVATTAELAGILSAIVKPATDTTFEQMTCAGYNPQTRTLEAVIEIKSNGGYNGNLCTAGSFEYVRFFAFVTGVWHDLGTAQVNVHDLKAVAPGKPVNYAVVKVSDVVSELCQNLVSVPLRAILSWQTIPSGPDFVPFWGNIINTQIQPQISSGLQGARLLRIGDVGVIGIQPSVNIFLSGDALANPTGVAEDCNNADDSPFAGGIGIEGDFSPKVAGAFDPVTGVVLLGAHPVMYRVFITPPPLVGPPSQLKNQFGIGVFPIAAPIGNPEVVIPQKTVPPYGPVNGGAPSDVYYTYYESAEGQLVNPRVVASFQAGGLPEGNYTVEIDGYQWDGANYQPMAPVSKTFYVYNGYLPGGGAPLDTLTLTSAADCGNITVGDKITGKYSVTDEFFGAVTVAMTQVFISNIPVAMPTVYLSNGNSGPNSVVYNGTNTGGTTGTFTIFTGNYDPNKDPLNNKQPNQVPLPACGYTIELIADDRALVSTTCNHHESREAVGFCLVAKKA
jgi:hypothetical protein